MRIIFNKGCGMTRMSSGSGEDICEEFIGLVIKVSETLKSNAGDLSPENQAVTTCLTHFVAAVLDLKKTGDPALEGRIMRDETVRMRREDMLNHLSDAECCMERYFAESLTQYPALSAQSLDDFPYRANYRRIVEDEIAAIRKAGLDLSGKRIVFAGSGPLPLTAIEMCYALPDEDIHIICLDTDREAVRLSSSLIERLGLSERITVRHGDAENFDFRDTGPLSGSAPDLVYIASLICEKSRVLTRIKTTCPGAFVAIRSVEGIKTLLYEPVDPREVTEYGYTNVGKSPDAPDTINTLLIFAPEPQVRGPHPPWHSGPDNGSGQVKPKEFGMA